MLEAFFYMFVIFLTLNWKLLLLAAALIALVYVLLGRSTPKDGRVKMTISRVAGLTGISFMIFFGVWFVYVLVVTKGTMHAY